jgi:hypothetical protein
MGVRAGWLGCGTPLSFPWARSFLLDTIAESGADKKECPSWVGWPAGASVASDEMVVGFDDVAPCHEPPLGRVFIHPDCSAIADWC